MNLSDLLSKGLVEKFKSDKRQIGNEMNIAIQNISSAKKIVTDSGGIQKEGYLLSIPCITIRDNTEWVETMQGGWNILTGVHTNKIVKAVRDWVPTCPL